MLKKKSFCKFGKVYYLLGQKENGTYIYLERPTFDCGWYWGGLYLESFTNNRNPERSRDISTHSHVDYEILKKDSNVYETFKKVFKDSVLTDKEIWKFLELCSQFYTLKDMAALAHNKCAGISSQVELTEEAKDSYNDMYKTLIAKQLPEVLTNICNMLLEENNFIDDRTFTGQLI